MYVWGLAGSVGMEAQVKALAEALELDVHMKNLPVRPPFVWLPNVFFSAGLKRLVIPYMLESGHDRLAPPWPDMVISCGRRAAITALALQHEIPRAVARQAKKHRPDDTYTSSLKTRFVHIQDPLISPKHFDLVIAMRHDAMHGDNVLQMEYALHRITEDKLQRATALHAPLFASYPRPYVSVLLGGSTNKYTLTREAMQEVITKLRAMLESMSGSLLITVSARTGEDNIRLLKEVFYDNPRVYVYDGKGSSNPYLGLLGVADHIVISNDSVNMMSEAAATGKPLYSLLLPGHTDTKPAHFAEKLLMQGVARLWAGTWEQWSYDAGNEMRELTRQVKGKLAI